MSSLLAITMGCPVGIGPEIVIRFHDRQSNNSAYQPVVLGDPDVLQRCADELGSKAEIITWQPGDLVKKDAVNVMPLSNMGRELGWGKPDAATGKAMATYIEEAVRLADQGIVAGIVTCPITKTALALAGYKYPGHTEMLATLTGTTRYAMMMSGSLLKVTLVSIHVALAEVPKVISIENIFEMIGITVRALQQDFGIIEPRLAVAGLNPHAGEGKMFGDEEERLISPAINQALAKGWDVSGPFPPDTVFNKASSGEYDAVVCMYHDQGLIPFKLLHFEDGVNVTLGLPIIRTSVDHGTAYDIAGMGRANEASLTSAYDLAGKIADNRNRFAENRKMY